MKNGSEQKWFKFLLTKVHDYFEKYLKYFTSDSPKYKLDPFCHQKSPSMYESYVGPNLVETLICIYVVILTLIIV